MAQTVRMIPYRGEDDYQRMRELLLEIYRLTGKNVAWDVVRLDSYRYGRFWQEERDNHHPWAADMGLWETAAGKLVAIAHPEGDKEWFFDMHPDFYHLAPQMLDWIEERHGARRPSPTTDWLLNIVIHSELTELAALLAGRGFTDNGPAEVTRTHPLAGPVVVGELGEGYEGRPFNFADPTDCEQRALIAKLVFGTTAPPEAYPIKNLAPTWHETWGIFTADGEAAAYCTIWLDDNRTGCFEPVGTHPDHRRRGLARTMMQHGLRRLQELGAQRVTVGTGYDMDANHLYAALGFSQVEVFHQWQKEG
ncbi:MAG: GNAT family N-acetyltransferase [Anaerolineales bacterium]|nr:GNAT family N-acetyltransferase [Anaerolineales bacterium]